MYDVPGRSAVEQKQQSRRCSASAASFSFDDIVGHASILTDVISQVRKVAATDVSVLINGETGTGKEVFAQAIHHASPRNDHAFLALNCSAFSRELLESELFGYKAGAFTGAVKDKRGLLEEANHGTLFLDEIGEMALELQSKLLRAYSWPGNVREMMNAIEHALIVCEEVITRSDLPIDMLSGETPIVCDDSLDLKSVERNHIIKVLHHTHGNKTETARLLKIGLTTLYRKIEEYGII